MNPLTWTFPTAEMTVGSANNELHAAHINEHTDAQRERKRIVDRIKQRIAVLSPSNSIVEPIVTDSLSIWHIKDSTTYLPRAIASRTSI